MVRHLTLCGVAVRVCSVAASGWAFITPLILMQWALGYRYVGKRRGLSRRSGAA